MLKRQLGKKGLEVSALGWDAWVSAMPMAQPWRRKQLPL